MSQATANLTRMTYKQSKQVTDTVTLCLYGTPTPKGRPRFTRTGRTYTPAKTKTAEQQLRDAWVITTNRRRPPHDGPVSVEFHAYFVPPASWPKWKREAALAGHLIHTTKPDADNLAKTIDALNGVAWLDDAQVFHAMTAKHYDTVAKTVIKITFYPPLPAKTKPKGN